MKIRDIINEDFDNNPEWPLVTLLTTFIAQDIPEVPYEGFLKDIQRQGYDVDEGWMNEFLDRQKQAGIIASYDDDLIKITADDEDENTDETGDNKSDKNEEADADTKETADKNHVTKLATGVAKKKVKNGL